MAGALRKSFAASMAKQGLDADAEVAAFLGAAGDAQQFLLEQVDANFAAGPHQATVFVADTIPPKSSARIVEFPLNEQMKETFCAIELSWFESDGGVTALYTARYRRDRASANQKAARGALSPIGRHLDKRTPWTRGGRRRSRRKFHNPDRRHRWSGGGNVGAGFDYGGFQRAGRSARPAAPTITRTQGVSTEFAFGHLVSRPAFSRRRIASVL